MSSFWGIITARSGSKRLIEKNKKFLINKPMIEYTYISTLNSSLDKVILSTNCLDCIEYSKKYKHIECPFIRPDYLCEDDTKHMDVIKHCIEYYKNTLNEKLPDYIVILQPTTPQRTTEDIANMLEYINTNKHLNGITTISETNIQSNKIYNCKDNSNDNKKLLYENGMFFIIKTSTLLNNLNDLNESKCSLPYKNIEQVFYPKNKIICDIDTKEDFEYVEFLMKNENKKKIKNEIKIGERIINDKNKPFIIVEIGINHEGDIKKAIKMVYDAYYSGAECVKFQCHIPDKEMTNEAINIIPSNSSDNIYNIIDRCSFSKEQEIYIKKIVEDLGMIYLCTPFSIEAANRLEEMNVQAYKIGSGEMNNLQLIEHIAKFGKPMLISTGMNPLHKIRQTVKIIEKYNIPYCLFHCVSIYPTPYDKVNLPGVDDLIFEFPKAIIGLSDHSIGLSSCFGAYMKGVIVFEKHFTSYKTWNGPDIEISITPYELNNLIIQLNELRECNKGKGRYIIQKEEQGTIDFAFSTLTTTNDLQEGHILCENDLIAKRPNVGDFLAEDISFLIGKKINQNLKKDTKLFNLHLK